MKIFREIFRKNVSESETPLTSEHLKNAITRAAESPRDLIYVLPDWFRLYPWAVEKVKSGEAVWETKIEVRA